MSRKWCFVPFLQWTWTNKSWFVHLSVDVELFPLWGYCEQGCLVYLSKVFAELMLIKFWYSPNEHLRVELPGHRVCACVCSHTQSSLTFWDLMDCSLWVSSVYGAFQARILEQVAISFSRVSSWPKDQTHLPCLAGRFFTTKPLPKMRKCLISHCHCSPCLLQSLGTMRRACPSQGNIQTHSWRFLHMIKVSFQGCWFCQLWYKYLYWRVI